LMTWGNFVLNFPQRRTRTDSISTRPRFDPNNGAIHRQQTEAAARRS
jgi:hypothetical protein